MDDIFEMQVEFNFLKAFYVQLQKTFGDCRDVFINYHKSGVEGFQGQEKKARG